MSEQKKHGIVKVKWFWCTIVLGMLCLFPLSGHANRPCEAQSDAAFYKIKKVIIYFGVLPHPADQLKSDFPPELKTEALKEMVTKVALDNFKPCFEDVERDYVGFAKNSEDVLLYDPDNVVFRIDLVWPNYINGDKKTAYAVLQTQVFRYGLDPRVARTTLNRTYSFAFFPYLETFQPLSITLQEKLSQALFPFGWGAPPHIENEIMPHLKDK